MAAAPADERSAADALVAEGRPFEAEGTNSAVNGTLDRDHAIAERWARRRFGERHSTPRF